MADAFWPWPGMVALAAGALAVFLLLEWRRLPAVAHVFIVASALLAAFAALLLPSPRPLLAEAVARSCFYAAFLTALGFLRIAADRSVLMRQCGRFVIRQMPSLRYAALALGTVLFGTILSVGVLNLLSAATTRGNTLAAAGGERQVQETRLRRMALALLRGFGGLPLASPLSISYVVILASLPGVRLPVLLALGMLSACAVLMLGWLYDWLTRPRHLAHLVPNFERERELTPLLKFAALVLLLTGAAVALDAASPLSFPLSVACLAPLLAIVWVLWQYRRFGPRWAVASIRRRAPRLFSSLRAEVAVVGGAGFLGVLVAGVIPAEALSSWILTYGIEGLPLIILSMVAVVALALVGVNPMVTIIVLTATFSRLGDLALPIELYALGLMLGWSVAVTVSPFTATALVLSRLIERPATMLTFRWNGKFALLLVLFNLLWMAGITLAYQTFFAGAG